MSLANDNYYGYTHKLLVEKQITWLECAASSLVWTTIMVHYLEIPYGHLMLESMEGATARTQARGNLFSFTLPWEDIEKRCQEAELKNAINAAERSLTLPHSEDVLATLLNVHIVGGTKDLVEHLEGATMRTEVVLSLIAQLRKSGYPGYGDDCNSDAAVRGRMSDLYESKYGVGPFVPNKVRDAAGLAHRARLSGPSLIQDKNATPSEPASSIESLAQTLRPLSLVAQRSSNTASTAYEEHGTVLSQYQNLEVQTGSVMMDQFRPQYLGMAYPYTLPAAVGGYDMPGQPKWRRPDRAQVEERPLELRDPFFSNQVQTEPARVKLYDVTRGLPRRIEAQYRRHWAFVPGLWNL
jgi:hypothetical protein